MSLPEIPVKVYAPTDPEGKKELARRVAEIHASYVARRIQALDCPVSQKKALLDAVIATAQENAAANSVTHQEVRER